MVGAFDPMALVRCGAERNRRWGVLILPYPIGWSMGIWGPGSPRWLSALSIAVGLWYQAILAITGARGSAARRGTHNRKPMDEASSSGEDARL
jgi:hypothetical protein